MNESSVASDSFRDLLCDKMGSSDTFSGIVDLVCSETFEGRMFYTWLVRIGRDTNEGSVAEKRNRCPPVLRVFKVKILEM